MSLDNIIEKTPQERIKAIREFEEASRKRVAQAMDASKKARQRASTLFKQVPKWAGGMSIEDIKNKAPQTVTLKEEDRKAFDKLKDIVDQINALKLKESGASEKAAKASAVSAATRKRHMTKV